MKTESPSEVSGIPAAKPSQLPEFRIDTGDSNVGPVGFVAYVRAPDAEKALEVLRDKVDTAGYQVEDDEGFSVHVYLNPANVKITEVEQCEDNEIDEEDGSEG